MSQRHLAAGDDDDGAAAGAERRPPATASSFAERRDPARAWNDEEPLSTSSILLSMLHLYFCSITTRRCAPLQVRIQRKKLLTRSSIVLGNTNIFDTYAKNESMMENCAKMF